MIVWSTHALHPAVTARLAAVCDFRVTSTPTATMAEALDADILIVRAPVPAEYFAAAKNLRAAVRHGAGLDMIPMEAATAAGVVVANVPGANASTVAEYAVFAALALLRGFAEIDRTLRTQGWTDARAVTDRSRDLATRTLGIYGFGNIGQALHRLGAAFGMTVVAHTRRPATLPADVQPLSLDALCAASDVLVVCCPLTPETRGTINAARLAAMKPGAALINVARGPILDTPAVSAALQAHRICAALDVFDVQPLPADSLLWSLPNVIVTPHMAGITADSMLRMGQVTADEVMRLVAGHWPVNLCNPDVVPRVALSRAPPD